MAREVKGTKPVNILLRDRNILWVDNLKLSLRAGGVIIERAGLVRAILDGLEASGVDLAGVGSEDELAGLIAERLRAGAPKRGKGR